MIMDRRALQPSAEALLLFLLSGWMMSYSHWYRHRIFKSQWRFHNKIPHFQNKLLFNVVRVHFWYKIRKTAATKTLIEFQFFRSFYIHVHFIRFIFPFLSSFKRIFFNFLQMKTNHNSKSESEQKIIEKIFFAHRIKIPQIFNETWKFTQIDIKCWMPNCAR